MTFNLVQKKKLAKVVLQRFGVTLICDTLSSSKVSVSEVSSSLSVHECFAFRDMLISSCNVVFSGSICCWLRNVTYDHK